MCHLKSKIQELRNTVLFFSQWDETHGELKWINKKVVKTFYSQHCFCVEYGIGYIYVLLKIQFSGIAVCICFRCQFLFFYIVWLFHTCKYPSVGISSTCRSEFIRCHPKARLKLAIKIHHPSDYLQNSTWF